MKLTKKDFFDGQEMTEREKRIKQAAEDSLVTLIARTILICIGLSILITIVITNLKH